MDSQRAVDTRNCGLASTRTNKNEFCRSSILAYYQLKYKYWVGESNRSEVEDGASIKGGARQKSPCVTVFLPHISDIQNTSVTTSTHSTDTSGLFWCKFFSSFFLFERIKKVNNG